MNLYRSFGDLLETYVNDRRSFLSADEQTEPTDYSVSTTPASTPTSTPDMRITQRSESEDSGFEITTCSSIDAADSSQSSPGITDPSPVSVSTDGERRSLLPSFTLTSVQHPSISSSSPSLLLPSTNDAADPLPRDRCMSLHSKVEQALLNIPQNFRKARSVSNFNSNPEPVAQRRLPAKTLSLSRGLAAERVLRSGGVGEGSAVQLMLLRQGRHQRLERKARPTSLYHHMRLAQTPIEEVNEEPREALSPGLRYLEQVCQMGEKIAQRRTHNRSLHAEMEALSDHRATEPSSRLCVCEPPPEDHHSPAHRTTVLEFGQMSEEMQRSSTDEVLGETAPSDADTPTGLLSGSETNTRGQPESGTQPAEPEDAAQNQPAASQVPGGNRPLRPRGFSRAAFWKKAKSVDSAGAPQSRVSDTRRRIGQRFSMLIPRRNLQAQ